MATSHDRGHPIRYDNPETGWYYADTRESIDVERLCIRCGRPPTPEGHDACLGHLEGVTSACCGHGVHKPIMIRSKKERIMEEKQEAVNALQKVYEMSIESLCPESFAGMEVGLAELARTRRLEWDLFSAAKAPALKLEDLIDAAESTPPA